MQCPMRSITNTTQVSPSSREKRDDSPVGDQQVGCPQSSIVLSILELEESHHLVSCGVQDCCHSFMLSALVFPTVVAATMLMLLVHATELLVEL